MRLTFQTNRNYKNKKEKKLFPFSQRSGRNLTWIDK